ncbi:MAG: MarR family transcriptional regulator, partial [Mucinivorans sp.]
MENYQSARELILQMLKTRMAFRQALQHLLRDNNVEMTFEMLQIMTCLWHEQGVSQQMLAEKTSKDKACLTNLMSNLERRGWVT